MDYSRLCLAIIKATHKIIQQSPRRVELVYLDELYTL